MHKTPSLSKMKIAILDDHDLVREGLHAVLQQHGACYVDKFSTAHALMAQLEQGVTYDIFSIDLELPDIDGFQLIHRLRLSCPTAPIVVCTIHDEVWTLRKLFSMEVEAIVNKTSEGDTIIKAVHEVLAGNHYYCPAVLKAMASAQVASAHPSARELEVLYLIAQGKTTREIAAAMFVSDNTIEAHRKSLFAKLGAVNAADLVVKAIERGYLDKHGDIR